MCESSLGIKQKCVTIKLFRGIKGLEFITLIIEEYIASSNRKVRKLVTHSLYFIYLLDITSLICNSRDSLYKSLFSLFINW